MEGCCKKAIVTGASRGIGTGIAMSLAREGYDVAISYSTAEAQAREVAERIRGEYGRECHVFQAELSRPGAIEALVRDAAARLGGLDLLVNNAASTTAIGGIMDFSIEDLDYLVRLNLRGYLMGLREAARHMVAHGVRGNLISITSVRGGIAYPTDGVYGGIKAAVSRATESFALDLAPYGIRVNCVAPGAIRTRNLGARGTSAYEVRKEGEYGWLAPKIPLQRVGMPQDIGDAVAWLASDQASYITGVTLRVDGGLVLAGMPERPEDAGPDRGWGIPG